MIPEDTSTDPRVEAADTFKFWKSATSVGPPCPAASVT